MSDRPTPRMDAVRFRVGESDHWAVHEVYAKQLERELAEAMEEGEEQARLLGMSGEREAGLLAEIDRLKRELAEAREEIDECFAVFQFATECAGDMRKQRDEAKEALQSADRHNQHMLVELEEAREQRDRLAAALQDIKDRVLDETVRLHPDADAKGCVDDCLEWAESALAELEGGTDNA